MTSRVIFHLEPLRLTSTPRFVNYEPKLPPADDHEGNDAAALSAAMTTRLDHVNVFVRLRPDDSDQAVVVEALNGTSCRVQGLADPVDWDGVRVDIVREPARCRES